MIKIDKPWGYEMIWAKTDTYVSKVICIEAGHRLSKQYHKVKEESVYVIEGILVNETDEGQETYAPGNYLHIKPGQIHRFGTLKDRYVKIIEVSTNHLDDVVRIEDDYNRV